VSRDAEHNEQAMLFQWAALMVTRTPEMGMLFAIPNGGQRHPAVAAKLKAEGVKRGVPDLCLPVPRGKYHGLYLELKAGKNRATLEQRAWLDALDKLGYYTNVCIGWETARDEITAYLALPHFPANSSV
jgi:hypothetical protein